MTYSDTPNFAGSHQGSHQDHYHNSNPFSLLKSDPSVKVESTDPPDLAFALTAAPAFSYHRSRENSSVFHFGSESTSSPDPNFSFMSGPPWPVINSTSSGTSFSLQPNSNQPISFDADYEDGDELGDLPLMSGSPLGSSGKSAEKQVRRRSSKACDQCRKLKCKCERSGDSSQCRSCLMFNAQCTFLGPSRKRGPPKGYIDAIEVRLHQTEALIGILLSIAAGPRGDNIEHGDAQVRSLIEDLSQDPLAREIINRVDSTAYGFKGRQKSDAGSSTFATKIPSREQQNGSEQTKLHSTHPSHEWQDQLISKMRELRGNKRGSTQPSFPDTKPVLNVQSTSLDIPDAEGHQPSPRRLRRRIASHPDLCENTTPSISPRSPLPSSHPNFLSNLSYESSRMHSPDHEVEDNGEKEEKIEEAVGQLSLNEDEQVRFHGKASGLHLLAVTERVDGRNEGGIWKFPKARVWPPLPSSSESKTEEDFQISMPDQAMQEHLMVLYWTYVHPTLPIVHKQSFIESSQRGQATADSPYSGSQTSTSSNSSRGMSHIPTVLLLAMFSIAARYSTSTPLPPQGAMWGAGDMYLRSAKTILASTYATPRVGTCQALLLLGYREVGIGDMAQAWIYVGMAVRMAQDLGMHKSAEKWQRIGGSMFSSTELQERRRIWYGCVVMDKYISTYIGRPVAIFEGDFDTELPDLDEMEELEVIEPPARSDSNTEIANTRRDLTSRCISCFNASAKISIILSRIVQAIYAIRPDTSRTARLVLFEESLEKWYLELPEWLRFDPITKSKPPPPHVMTLHMLYWCSMLLLHRPFIRHLTSASDSSRKETEVRAASRRSYDICVQAANRITTIVGAYRDTYSIQTSSVYLCYYLFTASITHVSTLTQYPNDPQARLGLNQCMDALKQMELLWPSARRAWEILNGSKVNLNNPMQAPRSAPRGTGDRQKRSADERLDDEESVERRGPMSFSDRFVGRVPAQPVFANVMPHLGNAQGGDMSYFASHKGWPSTGNPNAMNSLTTSVLPQQYSTGFVDTRGSSAMAMRGHSDNRYSQYWNDYSALGQLDPTYGVPVLPDSVPPQQPDVLHHNQTPPMYLSQPYSFFNSIPPNQRL